MDGSRGLGSRGGEDRYEVVAKRQRVTQTVEVDTVSLSAKKKTTKQPASANMLMKPVSAFFVFMEDFRQQYKEKHPSNKSVAAVGKAGGDKWKQMSTAEKAPYKAKAEKRNKTIEAYNKKLAEGPAEEEESDNSEDEDDDESGEAEGQAEEEESDNSEDEDDDESGEAEGLAEEEESDNSEDEDDDSEDEDDDESGDRV